MNWRDGLNTGIPGPRWPGMMRGEGRLEPVYTGKPVTRRIAFTRSAALL
jgi:hypothetical protein